MTVCGTSPAIQLVHDLARRSRRDDGGPALEPTGPVCVPDLAAELAAAWPGPLSQGHRAALDALCRRIALGSRLPLRFTREFQVMPDDPGLPPELDPAILSTLLAWAQSLQGCGDAGFAAKLVNAALAFCDGRPGIGPDLHEEARECADHLPMADPRPAADLVCEPEVGCGLPRRILPITVMAYEGPCARAYLSAMKRMGLRPRRILLLVLSEHPQSHRPVGTWFPGRLRSWYAEKTQDMSLNCWPRRIRAASPELSRCIAAGMAPIIDRPAALVSEMYDRFSYDGCADTVERISVRGLRDPALQDALSRLEPGTVLFTGGGILPASIIRQPGLRFLHVHPGHLPHVRGADGLLWSTLARGRPSMTCFWLAAGLDTGDIVATADYPRLRLDLDGLVPRPDDQTLYRAMFSYIDPLLRADLLVRVLARADDPADLPRRSQNAGEGVTYHFMHPHLRHRVLSRLFTS
jgi:hypothetical protein